MRPGGCCPFLCLDSGFAPHLSGWEKNEGPCLDDNGNDTRRFPERGLLSSWEVGEASDVHHLISS